MTEAYPGASQPTTLDIVSFRLGERMYALPLGAVVQIIPILTITPLPQAHPAVDGIINFRGKSVPVINMRRYLESHSTPWGLHTPIILVTLEQWMVGLMVDEVLSVTTLRQESLSRLEAVLPDGLGRSQLLEGVIHTESGTLMLLNLNHLFSQQQVQALTQLLTLPVAPAQEPDDESAA